MGRINSLGNVLLGITGPNSFAYNNSSGTLTANGKSGYGGRNAFVVTDSNGLATGVLGFVPLMQTANVSVVNYNMSASGSGQIIRFIGTSNAATCFLPSSLGLVLGQSYTIINDSSQNVVIKTSANAIVKILNAGNSAIITHNGTGLNVATSFSVSSLVANPVVLSPTAAQTITSQNLILQAGSFNSGSSTGGFSGSFKAFATTASSGSLSLTAANNSGNFTNVLTNASTTADRTYTLPDSSGTVLLDTTVGSSFVSLVPSADQTITNGFSLINSLGAFVSGDVGAGGFAGKFTAYSPTAALGSLEVVASDSAGAYIGTLTNASLATTNQTWTLPDASGTILLDGTAVSLNPTADQTINGAFNLTNSQGGFFAPFNYFTSGSAAGGLGGAFRAYPFTASAGLLQLTATDSSGDFVGTLTNASLSADRAWSLPDQGGTVTVLGNTVSGTGSIVLDTSATLITPASLGAQQSALNMNSNLINNVTDPSSPQDAATKNYVDSVAQGRVFKDPCTAATVAQFVATYNNGASGVGATLTATSTGVYAPDGVTIALNDRVLVKDQATTSQNGIYVISTLGAVGVAAILTRSTDMNQPTEFVGATTFITSGTVNGGRLYTETATVSVVGTDPVTFVQSGDATTGIVSTGTANQLAYYASNGNTISGLASAANGVLVTSAGSVPSISSTLPSGMAATNMTLTTPTLTNPKINGVLDANGNINTVFIGIPSAVNYFTINNSISGDPIAIQAAGTDANIGFAVITKGTGAAQIFTAAPTQPLKITSGTGNQHVSTFNFANTAGTFNYTFPDASGTVTVLGNASTGSGSVVLATSPTITTPVIAQINDTTSAAVMQFANGGASAVNFFNASNGVTGAPAVLQTLGADADISMQLIAKGAGQFALTTTNTSPLILLSGTASQRRSVFEFGNTSATFTYTYPSANGTVQLQGQTAIVTNLSTAPANSASSTLAVGTAYQNTLGYDVVLTVYLSVTAATTANILLGVGSTNTPTQQTIISGLSTAALSIIPVTIYLPNQYYALLSTSGTITQTISGQQAMPV